jgi:hypothetical protein
MLDFITLLSLLLSSWSNYRDAMSRRRPESVLSKYRWVRHGLFNAHVYESSHGIIFYNEYDNGIKIPSHFAPRSLRSGVLMMKELLESGEWILLIPEDLMVMARKVGFTVLPWTLPQEFNGETIDKHICISSPLQMLLLTGLAAEYQQTGEFPNGIEKDTSMYPDNAYDIFNRVFHRDTTIEEEEERAIREDFNSLSKYELMARDYLVTNSYRINWSEELQHYR